MALFDQGETNCCYARSGKYWVTDPQGVAWEHFHTMANIPVFSEKTVRTAENAAGCTPTTPRGKPIGIAVKAASSCCC
jgi:hypothetical protein